MDRRAKIATYIIMEKHMQICSNQQNLQDSICVTQHIVSQNTS